MKKLLCLTLSIMLMSQQVLAECQNPVTALEQGAQAPCRGYLFSPTKEKELRLLNEDYKLVKEELDYKNSKIKLLNDNLKLSDDILQKERERTELWRVTAENSTLQLVKSNEGQGRRDLWMILLGVGITVGAGYALGQVNK